MRKANYNKTTIPVDTDLYECKSIEREIEQAETTKQPIEATSPIIYTPRKDGVKPEYDIRTDRFEIAQDAMNKVAASYQAKRADWIKSLESGTGTAEA